MPPLARSGWPTTAAMSAVTTSDAADGAVMNRSASTDAGSWATAFDEQIELRLNTVEFCFEAVYFRFEAVEYCFEAVYYRLEAV